METVNRDWDSYAYGVRAQADVNGVKQVLFIDRTTSASTWASADAGRHYGPFGVEYPSFGPIRPDLTYEQIKNIGVQLSKVNGSYNYITNKLSDDCVKVIRKYQTGFSPRLGQLL